MATDAEEFLTHALGHSGPANVTPTTQEALARKMKIYLERCREEDRRKVQQMRHEKLQAALQTVGLPKRFQPLTLASFERVIGDDKVKRIALGVATKFLEAGHYNGKTSLVFWSEQRGVGKTGLATALFSALLAKDPDTPGLWLDYQDLLDLIRRGFRDSKVDPYELQHKAAHTPLLLLDGLGSNVRQDVSEAVAEITAKIVSYRHRELLPTLFTTNLTPHATKLQLGEDTSQRLAEMSTWVNVGGQVLRSQS